MILPIPTRDGVTEVELKRPNSDTAVIAHDLLENGKHGSALRMLVQDSCPGLASPSLMPWRAADLISIEAWNLGRKNISTAVVGICPHCPNETITMLDMLEENGEVIYDNRIKLSELKRRGCACDDPPRAATTYEECNFRHDLLEPIELLEQGNITATITAFIVRHPLIADLLELENQGIKGTGRAGAEVVKKCLVDADGTMTPEISMKHETLFDYLKNVHPHRLGVFPHADDLHAISYEIMNPGLQNTTVMNCRVCGKEFDAEIPTHNFFSPGQATNGSRTRRTASSPGRTIDL